MDNGELKIEVSEIMAFQFENLDVYKKPLDWVEAVETLCESLKGKKHQFFRIARGSAFECVPIIQVLHRENLITDPRYHGSVSDDCENYFSGFYHLFACVCRSGTWSSLFMVDIFIDWSFDLVRKLKFRSPSAVFSLRESH